MRAPRKVAIIGLGLVGASLGRALRKRGRYIVIGCDRSAAALAQARRVKALDEVRAGAPSAVRDADLCVLAAPPNASRRLLRAVWGRARAGALITDVVSVKGPLLKTARDLRRRGLRRGPVYIGSHPLAGSEKSGTEHSRADLFAGAACALIKEPRQSPRAKKLLESLWRDAGCRPLWLSAPEHDRWLARTSHLPHLIAAALCDALGPHAARSPRLRRLAGGALKDMTRIAESNPALWSEICRANAGPLRAAKQEFQRSLDKLFREDFSAARLRSAVRSRRRLIAPLLPGQKHQQT